MTSGTESIPNPSHSSSSTLKRQLPPHSSSSMSAITNANNVMNSKGTKVPTSLSSPPSSSLSSPPSSLVVSSSSNKKTKRWPLHVEAVVHPCCTISFQNLEVAIEKFVQSVGQSSFMVRLRYHLYFASVNLIQIYE